jgi:Arc/MetJ family transcription regulator
LRTDEVLKLTPIGGSFGTSCPAVVTMRTTIRLDDDLLAKAQALTGLRGVSNVVREALKAFIERESARRLASLGGTQPRLKPPPRRGSSSR